MDEDEGSGAGLVIVLAFLVILWLLRALFLAADQSK